MIGKILEVFGLLTGSIGFTAEICMGRKNQILLLKEIREMFCLIQGEIDYTALPLPEIFRNLSEKIKEPLSGALREAAGRLTMEQGETIRELWQKEMEKALASYHLSGNQKQILFSFPDGFAENEYRGQARAIDRYIRDMDREIQQCEEELKSKNRIIMSLGIAAGLFLVIVLL